MKKKKRFSLLDTNFTIIIIIINFINDQCLSMLLIFDINVTIFINI